MNAMSYDRLAVRLILWMALALMGLGLGCRRAVVWNAKQEVEIGKQGSAEIEKEYKLDKNPARVRLVDDIGARLVKVAGKKEYAYTFKALDLDDINAVSLPGGPVYVFRGLIEAAGDEDEISGVMGHELGHINARHINKQQTKRLAINLAVLIGTKGRPSDLTDIGSALLMLQYSRDDEYEADRLGIEYNYKAGYDPHGIVRFFERLQKLEKGGDKGILANLRSHPLTENRIWRAQEHIAKVTGTPAPPKPGGKK